MTDLDICTILQAFQLVKHSHPDYDVNKIFLKLQRTIVEKIESSDVNTFFKTLRMYADLEVQQTALYEEAARLLEERLDQLDTQGFVDALCSVL